MQTARLIALAASAVLTAPAVWAQQTESDGPWTLQAALGDPSGIRIEGHVRGRYEALANPFVAGRTDDDEFFGLQTQIRAEFDLGADFTLGGELLDHRFVFGNETGGAPSEIDTLEPAQAYIAWRPRDFLLPGARLDAKAGRFTIDIGSRRLTARANFRSLLQSFDGAHAVWTSPTGLHLTLTSVSPVARRPSDAASAIDNEVALNRTQDNVRLNVIHLDAPLPHDIRGEAYLFDLDEDDASDAATRNRDLSTFGARLHRNPARNTFDFDVEYVRQTGSVRASTNPADITPLDHAADMAHLEAGFSFDAPWSPRLAAQYDYASGDASAADGENQRFDAIFGDRSFELGPTSLFGLVARTNFSSPALRLEVHPDPVSDAYLMVRHIALDSATDSFANSGVRNAAGTSGDDAGTMIEARWRRWLIEDSLRLTFGGAVMFEGDFLKTAPNATGFGDPVYAYTDLTWSF